MTQPSQTPVRFFTGVCTDQPFQPLGFYGNRNPHFYHEWEDDFDGISAVYTQTKTTGAVAAAAGDGGLVTLTTSATLNDETAIQLPAASFSFTAGKKSFFLCRLKVDDATNAKFNVGLMNTTATHFAPTDGLFFKKAAGATTLVLESMVGSVATDIAIPAAQYPVSGNFIDMGFYVDRNQNVLAYVGFPLIGWVQQNVAQLGPVARGVPALTAVNLNLTIAVGAGTAAVRTMTLDSAMAAKER